MYLISRLLGKKMQLVARNGLLSRIEWSVLLPVILAGHVPHSLMTVRAKLVLTFGPTFGGFETDAHAALRLRVLGG
jgi:hypothetical protein